MCFQPEPAGMVLNQEGEKNPHDIVKPQTMQHNNPRL